MSASTHVMPTSGNRRTLMVLGLVAVAMVGLSYASVPLYKLFCQVTGYGGTTQVAEKAVDQIVVGHPVNVRFDANVNAALNWRFEPVDRMVKVNPGEEVVINYRATNLGPTPSTGTSTFNVTPVKAGPHFMKLDCFCFIEQTLQPGETVDMPVRFFVDPEIVTDENAKDIQEITLSYTFFPALGKGPADSQGQ
jgi:cytochrome c oxidase assembly protein subunit 11